MCSVFVIFESAFSNMMQLKSYTNRMADGTCMPACAWRLRKLKRTLTLSPKTRNKELICYFVGVLFIFFLPEKLYFESQTNKQKTVNLPYNQKLRQACSKMRSVRTANESFNCNEVPLFAACKFFLKAYCGPSCSQSWTTLVYFIID